MQENDPLESNNNPSEPNNHDDQAQSDSEQNDQPSTGSEQAQQTQDTAQEQSPASSTNANLPEWLQAEIKSGSSESETQYTSAPRFSWESGSSTSAPRLSWQNRSVDSRGKIVSTHYSAPERGGCLSAWLILLGIGDILAILDAFATLGTNAIGGLLLLIGGAAALVGVIGTWQFKRWGCYTLITFYILNGVFGLFSGNPGVGIGSIIGALIGMGILYLLVHDKWEAFE